jgi:hypothetical protein
MKKIGNFFSIIFIFGILIISVFLLYHYSFSKNIQLENYLSDYLSGVSFLKGEVVLDYISENEKNLDFVKNTFEVKQILKMTPTADEIIAMNIIHNKLDIVMKDITNYLIFSREKSLSELKKDLNFENFAVQTVGGRGYTSVILDDSTIIFHKFPLFVGLNILEDKSLDKRLKNIIFEAIENGSSEGVYDWVEPDGESGEKFIVVKKNLIKISEDYSLLVASTGYFSEFKTIKDINLNLNKSLFEFINNFEYDNLILISEFGNAVYMVNQNEHLGTNINDWREYDFSEIFKKINETKETIIFGPFIENRDDNSLKIGIIGSVYDGKKFLGYILLIKQMNSLNSIVENFEGLKETGDVYLVDNSRLLISNPRFKNFDLLVQEVNTESSNICIKHLQGEGFDENFEGAHKIYGYLNYYGDLVFGTHFPIFKTQWCLIVEVDDSEFFEGIWKNKYFWTIIYFNIFCLILCILFKFYLDKYYRLEKKK